MRDYQRLFFGAAGSMAASLILGLGGGAAWAAGHGGGTSGGADSPPGNNGTVKIDQYSMDRGQDNDPHISCGFSVNFYGYDGGPQDATIYVTPVAPTSGGHSYTTSTNWDVGTRTSGAQFDKTVPVTSSDLAPTLSGVTPQAQQGYHLRLEVEVSGSQGSNDKYKEFWLKPCSSGSTSPGGGGHGTSPGGSGGQGGSTGGGTPGTPGGSGTGTPGSGTGTPGSGTPGSGTPAGGTPSGGTHVNSPAPATGTPSAPKPAVLAAGGSSASALSSTPGSARALPASTAGSNASPLASSFSTSGSRAVPLAGQTAGSGSLAFTGIDVAGLLAAGLGLIAAGLLLTVRWRRAHA